MHTYIHTPSQQPSTNTARNKKITKNACDLHPHARTRHNNTTNTTNTQNRQQTQQQIHVYIYMYKKTPLNQDQKQDKTAKKKKKQTQRIEYAGTFTQILFRYRASPQELPGQTGNKTNVYYHTFLTVPALVEHISFCVPAPKKQTHPQNHSAPAPAIYIALYTGT